MKKLIKQALVTIGEGLAGVEAGDRFGIAFLSIVLVCLLVFVTFMKPLAGLAIIAIVGGIAAVYLIVFPWLMSFSE